MSSIDNQNKRTALIRHRRHTSGSTGLPKPITWTHESAVRHMRNTDLEPPEGGFTSAERLMAGKRVMVTTPPFHVSMPPKQADS